MPCLDSEPGSHFRQRLLFLQQDLFRGSKEWKGGFIPRLPVLEARESGASDRHRGEVPYGGTPPQGRGSVSYTHLRAHETRHDLVCRLLLEKKKKKKIKKGQ